jgi:phosphoribosylformimino-5-aminoimidazole carboxamide ribonucleotide (ProFAR) isomerase
MGKYAKAQGWKKFVSIYNTGGELFGDINGNGSVAGNDVTALKKVIAGTRTETDACDVNSSGGVTGADVTALKKVIAGTY